MSKNNEKLIDLVSKVLIVEVETVTDETSPENTASWDSYNALLMVSELEDEFNVHFSIEEVYSVKCVKDIRDALCRHHVSFE